MEERQVSVEGTPRPLPEPFLVAATQNPIEYEGTYPLPEAQLDRFLVKLTVGLPERDEEIGILARHAAGFDPGNLAATGIRPVAGPAELAAATAAVRNVRVAGDVAGYIVDLCRATRQSPALRLGVSPRGDRAAGDQPGLGLAGGPRLRHPGRREGAGPAHLAAPGPAPARGRTRRRDAGRRAGVGARVRAGAPVTRPWPFPAGRHWLRWPARWWYWRSVPWARGWR
jgi:MoxR-like ATPase